LKYINLCYKNIIYQKHFNFQKFRFNAFSADAFLVSMPTFIVGIRKPLEACVGVSHSERSEGMGASSNGGLPKADCLLKADFLLTFF